MTADPIPLDSSPPLCLRENYAMQKMPCPVCCGADRRMVPAAVASETGFLCSSCAEKLAPDLHRMARALEALFFQPPERTWLGKPGN